MSWRYNGSRQVIKLACKHKEVVLHSNTEELATAVVTETTKELQQDKNKMADDWTIDDATKERGGKHRVEKI